MCLFQYTSFQVLFVRLNETSLPLAIIAPQHTLTESQKSRRGMNTKC
jgi:hypothetical protein